MFFMEMFAGLPGLEAVTLNVTTVPNAMELVAVEVNPTLGESDGGNSGLEQAPATVPTSAANASRAARRDTRGRSGRIRPLAGSLHPERARLLDKSVPRS